MPELVEKTHRGRQYGHLASPLTAEQRRAVGAKEVPATVRLYLAGKIDQWWYRQDGKDYFDAAYS